MTVVQAVLFVLVGVGGGCVALARDPLRQAVLAGIFGLLLALAEVRSHEERDKE